MSGRGLWVVGGVTVLAVSTVAAVKYTDESDSGRNGAITKFMPKQLKGAWPWWTWALFALSVSFGVVVVYTLVLHFAHRTDGVGGGQTVGNGVASGRMTPPIPPSPVATWIKEEEEEITSPSTPVDESTGEEEAAALPPVPVGNAPRRGGRPLTFLDRERMAREAEIAAREAAKEAEAAAIKKRLQDAIPTVAEQKQNRKNLVRDAGKILESIQMADNKDELSRMELDYGSALHKAFPESVVEKMFGKMIMAQTGAREIPFGTKVWPIVTYYDGERLPQWRVEWASDPLVSLQSIEEMYKNNPRVLDAYPYQRRNFVFDIATEKFTEVPLVR